MDLDSDNPPFAARRLHRQAWINASDTINIREKLVRFLRGNAYLPKQR